MQLCYSKRNGDDAGILEDDLRICLVRPVTDIDRRFCFEIVSPTKFHMLQADSEYQYKYWQDTLKQSISSALNSTDVEPQWEDSDPEDVKDTKLGPGNQKKRRSAEQIIIIPGNDVCADCGAAEPQWASINWGVVLCIDCGGIHRSLGVHISKVRGIQLDMWDPEILKVMAELGNKIVNNILEADIGNRRKPGPGDSRAAKEEWINDKYRNKKFVNKNVFQSKDIEDADYWTVKRLRRRMRSSGKGRAKDSETSSEVSSKEACDRDEKDIDTSQEDTDDSSLLESVLKASTLSGSSTSSWMESKQAKKVMNAEVCLFGGSLGKHHVASVKLDSDQESTDGEGEESWSPPTDNMTQLNPERLLYRAARAHNLPVMLQALALDADTSWSCPDAGEDGRSAIHQSILSGSVMATEFLILNSVTTSSTDDHGNTALHLAANTGTTGQVCLLLKHRADYHCKNLEGNYEIPIFGFVQLNMVLVYNEA